MWSIVLLVPQGDEIPRWSLCWNTYIFSNTLVTKSLTLLILSNKIKTITMNLKSRISGFRRSNGYTYQNSQCPDMRNSEVGLSLIMIIETLSNDYHYFNASRFHDSGFTPRATFKCLMCKVVKAT